MIWLQSIPWVRWSLACFILIGSVWIEFRAETTELHPFTLEAMESGEPLSRANVEMREIPRGLLEPVAAEGFASRPLEPGQPLLPADVSDDAGVERSGWWAIEVAIPQGASLGDGVRIVLLDSGEVLEGIVSALPSDDPLGTGTGAVALPPDAAGPAAMAVAAGRFAVLVSTD